MSEIPPDASSGSTRHVQCPHCGGHGVVYNPHVEVGRFGSLEICSCVQCECGGTPPHMYWDEQSQRRWCDCATPRRRLAHIKELFKLSEVPTLFRFKLRDDFSPDAPDGTPLSVGGRVTQILQYLTALVDDDRDPPRGYLLHGPPGTGKTLISCIILNELLLHRARPGRLINLSRKFFHQLRDTFSEESEQYGRSYQIMDELCRIPYLVLDDFGVQRGTEWETEMLYDLIDARYSEENFTVVTTNKSMAEIEAISGGRVLSRLVEMCYVVPMNGQDYRQFMTHNMTG
ncbi:MAG: ATP-binding protein [Gemmatimonadetes bacterium]|nr:ATP-binding protein [Gemmatimonadota bacterium]MBT7863420.1 ATP-binding protein [Gemmatimonadota bacterium]